MAGRAQMLALRSLPRLAAGRMIGGVMNDNGGLAKVIDLAAFRLTRKPVPPAAPAALKKAA